MGSKEVQVPHVFLSLPLLARKLLKVNMSVSIVFVVFVFIVKDLSY